MRWRIFSKHKCWLSRVALEDGSEFAFSLVEVVIAIGLLSFALVALVGLLTAGLRSSRESADDTCLAFFTETTQALLRVEGFGQVSTNMSYAPGDEMPDFFFDSSGVLQTDSTGAPLKMQSQDSMYGCIVTRRSPTFFQGTANLLIYQIQFYWPLAAPATNRQHRMVPGSLANYE